MFTTYSIYLSYCAAGDVRNFSFRGKEDDEEKICEAMKLQSKHHIWYSISIISNLFVGIFYWSLLHKIKTKEHCNVPIYGPGRCVYLYIVHIIPGICCLLNTLMTNSVLKKSMYKIIIIIAIIYIPTNYV